MAGAEKRKRVTLAKDMAGLYKRARMEEQEGQHVTTDCEIVVSSHRVYAHSCLLIARSGFFERALTQQMKEAHEKVVELRHTATEVPKPAVEALLLFIYTGSTEGVSSMDIAWSVCDLLGAECGDFLELSMSEDLRSVCIDKILQEVKKENLMDVLLRARSLGHAGVQLRRLLLENLIWDSSSEVPAELRAKNHESLDLFCELLDVVKAIPKWGLRWAPSRIVWPEAAQESWKLTGSSFSIMMQNSVEALTTMDMSTGASTNLEVGPFLAFEFRKPVVVKAVHLGVGWTSEDLDGAELQCGDSSSGPWKFVMHLNIPEAECVYRLSLGEPMIARYWRMAYTDDVARCLAVSFVKFE